MPKSFKSYDEQIEDLKKEKGLNITDESAARKALADIGYFMLIGGYKYPFKDKTTKKYRSDVTFNDIILLYHFDEDLRRLFLRYLLSIERAIKARIAYVFCEAHGEKQQEYLDPKNYDDKNGNKKQQAGIAKLISKLTDLATKTTDYPYINHHQAIYGNVPLWVLINAVTFGSTSKMFGFLPQSLQSKVSRDYPLTISQLKEILSVLTKYRNACAHNERLFSYTTKDSIPDLLLHKKLRIPQKKGYYTCGKQDLFSVVIAFRYLLPREDYTSFKIELSKTIDKFSMKCTAFPQKDLLKSMGFPENWKNITRYKLQ